MEGVEDKGSRRDGVSGNSRPGPRGGVFRGLGGSSGKKPDDGGGCTDCPDCNFRRIRRLSQP